MAFVQADATRIPLADDAASLVIGSPPYADARSYGIGAQRNCQAWIDWMLQVTAEAVRVSRGLVLWVCAGVTRNWNYWPGPEGLLYEWWKRGGQAWRPAYWHRVGIPGSGGKQWLRADIEYVLAFTKCRGAVPWSDNTANGHRPKWAPGGEMSYRDTEGERKNFREGKDVGEGVRRKTVRSCMRAKNAFGVRTDIPIGTRRTGNKGENETYRAKKISRRISQGHGPEGDTRQDDVYVPPVLANPGCLIKGIKVGGGTMGHRLAHENEAPYPQKLAEWFIRSHCEPGGIVVDPFSGSGTTVAAAAALGRKAIGLDLRFSQCELGRRRCQEVQAEMF